MKKENIGLEIFLGPKIYGLGPLKNWQQSKDIEKKKAGIDGLSPCKAPNWTGLNSI
jgi:hypothetical protein